MQRLRRAFGSPSTPSRQDYEPLHDGDESTGIDQPSTLESSTVLELDHQGPFSWFEYGIFGLLGIAMLWAWNMFLAAAPYFDSRFRSSPWVRQNFQSAILTVSTIASLSSVLLLSYMQYSASYPFRINAALFINTAVFALLTCSSVMFLDVSPNTYFGFTLAMVAISAWATGLIQNGALAFAAGFGRPEYTQAVVAGQGVAGVLPAVAQVVSVLLFPPEEATSPDGGGSGEAAGSGRGQTSAFIYFLAAVAISVLTIIAFVPLLQRHNKLLERKLEQRLSESLNSVDQAERAARKVMSLWRLFRKLQWLAIGLALNFTETMFFPVFTAKIVSVKGANAGLLFQPAVFIPLGFLFWNSGDLTGRMLAALPNPLRRRPFVLFLITVLRAGWLPLYLLCNVNGKGAVVNSDFFYLFIIQLGFGISSGWLCSTYMVAAGNYVDEGEREAAGGFMGLCLVIGLTTGSLLTFMLSGI